MAEKTVSKRDGFRERFAKRNPELDMANEDAYYDQAGKMLDDLEGYEKKSSTLRSNIEKSPLLQEMIIASQEKDGFDPIAWLAENEGLDLEALVSDKDYLKKVSEARAKHLDLETKGGEIKAAQEKNLPASIDACLAKADELGISDDQAAAVIGDMFRIMDELIQGKIDVNLFAQMAKGSNYDTAVSDAKAEGIQQGLETKVEDKLRKMPATPNTQMGSQAPVREPKVAPKPKRRNPFLDD